MAPSPKYKKEHTIRGWGPPEETSLYISFDIWKCGNVVSAQHVLAGGRHEYARLRISRIYEDACPSSITSPGKSFLVASSLEIMPSNLKISWSFLPLKRVSHFAFVTKISCFPGKTANIFKSGPVWPHLYYWYGTHPTGPVPLIPIRASTCTFWGSKIQSITDP